jgi:integrase
MSRPKNNDGIRARQRARDGIQLVHFEEYPGHWIATPTHDREKAIAFAKRHRSQLVHRRIDPFGVLCADFFKPASQWVLRMCKKGHHYTDKYLLNRQGYVNNYIIPAFGERRPDTITRREIDDWLLDLKKKSRGELAGETKNKILYTLSLIFEELRDMGILETNPISGIKPYDKTPLKPRNTIDRESLAKLYPASHGEMVRIWGSSMWAAVMLIFNDTGSRPGEVRALRWKDIDIHRRFIPIRKGIEAGTVDKVKDTKTGAVKAAFLTKRTTQELDIWRAESRYNTGEDYCFTVNGAAPVTNEAIIKAFRRGLAAAGIDNRDWTPYWLRHSFGTYALESLKEDEISALMGNGVVVLRRHYLHPSDDTLYMANKAAQEKLDRAREH